MKKTLWILAVVVLAAMPSAFAQGNKPVNGYIATGWSGITGDASNILNDGWNISGGAIMHPNPQRPFGIRMDFAYNWWDVNNQTIQQASAFSRIDDGWAQTFSFAVDPLWEVGGKGKVGAYFGAGMDAITRYAAVTQTVYGSGIYCDPWYGWCYPASGTYQAISQDDRLTKLGWNAVLGITFQMSGGGKLYLEGSYTAMIGTKMEYIPVLIGYRW
jgi:hypothetical protein